MSNFEETLGWGHKSCTRLWSFTFAATDLEGSMTQDVKPVATVDPDISISEKFPDFSFNFPDGCEFSTHCHELIWKGAMSCPAKPWALSPAV